MLEVKNVDIKVSTRYLIRNLSFTLHKKDKVAIIGEEGNGKSTLLKSLLGICDYSTITGTVSFHGNTAGYLKQTICEKDLKKTVFSFLFIDEYDYYDKVNTLYKYLEDLQLEDTIIEKKMNVLSGGEKVKVGILKLLLGSYEIFFLDEPTNDLDIETLKWLENFINRTDKPILYVSHDETFLSKTANAILHIEQINKKEECKYTFQKVDYDTYVEKRSIALQKQRKLAKNEKREFQKKEEKLRKVMNKVEYMQDTISRKDPHGAKVLKKKMHSLKAQERKLENTCLIEFPDVEENIHFFFEDVSIPKNKVILKLDIPLLKVGDKVLSKNIKLDIIGNVHLCILGKNGTGKSTLMKYIYENLKDREDIKVGYMPQVYEDILDSYKSVLDFIASKKKEDITKARKYLGNLNFTKEEMTGKIKDLSNGTKAKLFLIKFVLDKCDVLILDEPTRNVSPLSNPVIREVLKDFRGTIISVSHDRKYIKEVTDKCYILTEKGLFLE